MAKLTGPMLSFGAKGQIGKTLVASKWRGVAYARQYTVPSNPKTTAQTVVRSTFALLREMWKLAPVQLQDAWNAFAQGRPFTGMNKEVGENVRVLNGAANMQNYIASPGAGGGLAPLNFQAVPGAVAGTIDTTFTVPAAPTGWTLVKAVAVGFKDQAPDGIFEAPISVAEDLTAPYAPTLANLPAGELCVCCGW
ncbi:MAG: hypothetical protein ACRCYS_08850, partial [Beijerinckiaceae bacterium]